MPRKSISFRIVVSKGNRQNCHCGQYWQYLSRYCQGEGHPQNPDRPSCRHVYPPVEMEESGSLNHRHLCSTSHSESKPPAL